MTIRTACTRVTIRKVHRPPILYLQFWRRSRAISGINQSFRRCTHKSPDTITHKPSSYIHNNISLHVTKNTDRAFITNGCNHVVCHYLATHKIQVGSKWLVYATWPNGSETRTCRIYNSHIQRCCCGCKWDSHLAPSNIEANIVYRHR